jgi:hypothetical protein
MITLFFTAVTVALFTAIAASVAVSVASVARA